MHPGLLAFQTAVLAGGVGELLGDSILLTVGRRGAAVLVLGARLATRLL